MIGAARNPKFSWLITVLLLIFVHLADAQQPKNFARIGYLSSLSPSSESVRSESIRRAFRELGYIEGQNIAIEAHYGEGKVDRAPKLAADLVRAKVDLILVTGGSNWIRAAKNATKTIPIVMVNSVLDAVEEGLVESLARPGGNITGLTLLFRDLAGKRLQVLKEASTKVVRVAVVYWPASPGTAREVKEELPAAARVLGLNVRSWEIRAAEDFAKVFAAIGKHRPDGLYLPTGALIRDNAQRIAGFALENRLPSVYPYSEAVDAGGLMSYSADLPASYQRVAHYVDKILKGAKPADLPVEQPTKFELVINSKPPNKSA